MTLPSAQNATYPTPQEILSQLLADIRYGYERIGVTANVSKGSEPYIRSQAIANRISIAIQNNKLALAGVSPLDADDEQLVELAGVFGITKRAASSAAGNVVVTTLSGWPVTIPSGFICTAPNGIQYETTVATTVVTGMVVEVVAKTTGADTEQVAGTVVTWDSAAIGYLDQNATVDTGGITGGSDEDSTEVLRRRLIQRLSFPEVGGNVAQMMTFAEEATSAVEAAFCYAAARGPASYDVVVTQTGGNRALSTANLNLVGANILGKMPGSADLNLTTVAEQQVDVILNATLPLPVNAGGAGGGWRDAVPWPSTAETGAGVFARVTSIANLLTLSQITVNSTAANPPVAGKRFGIWNYADHAMYEFTILPPIGGGPGAYVITIDTNQSDAINFIQVGMCCSAGAVNLKAYAEAFYDAVLLLGPGEKTDNIDILPRGRRQPSADVLWPTNLTNALLANVIEAHPELLELSYAARLDTGVATTRVGPSIATTTADPSRILTLKHFSIRRQV